MKKILPIILLLIIGLAFYVNSRSDELRVSRSIPISAPIEKIYNQVQDFHNWNKWSPWAKLDPNMVTEFEGAQNGEGAIMKWSGNKDVGVGTNTIIKTEPLSLVRTRLDFLKPFKSTSTAEFTFEPTEGHTLVTWTMLGKKNFMMKGMSLVMDCDKMIGGDFEKGLANLKELVE